MRLMEKQEIDALVHDCLRYIKASKLPSPLPTNPLEYAEWREDAKAERDIDEHAEDAWFELDRLLADDPQNGWPILIELASRCGDEDACAQVATGPLSTFIRSHGDAFASEIEEELMRNTGFRNAYNWLRE